MHFEFHEKEKKILETISIAAKELGIDAYAVGGYVRDKILQRTSTDMDIVCVGSGIELAQKSASLFSQKPKVNFFKRFGTAMFKVYGWDIEFVGARKESYRSDSRNPIVEDGTLEDDQLRRDFTVNAMAISLRQEDFGSLIDPFNGLEDLQNKILRTPLDPSATFNDDPLRMMRAVRFASQLNFSIEKKALKAIPPLADRLHILSQERITDELNKIILSPVPSVGFNLLFNTGLLHQFFPEMVNLQGVKMIENFGHKDNFYHTLQVLDNISKATDNLWIRWAAILHDIAKPATQKFEEGHGWTFHGHEVVGSKWVPKIFKRLKLPLNDKMRLVKKLVYLHLRPISLTQDNITDSAIRRLIFDAGEDIEALMMLCEADITSKNARKVKRYTQNLKMVQERIKIVEERDRIRNWQPLVDGDLIMSIFNIRPSREVGIIKNQLKEAILEGEIPNNFEASLEYVIKVGEDIGLKAVHIPTNHAQ